MWRQLRIDVTSLLWNWKDLHGVGYSWRKFPLSPRQKGTPYCFIGSRSRNTRFSIVSAMVRISPPCAAAQRRLARFTTLPRTNTPCDCAFRKRLPLFRPWPRLYPSAVWTPSGERSSIHLSAPVEWRHRHPERAGRGPPADGAPNKAMNPSPRICLSSRCFFDAGHHNLKKS